MAAISSRHINALATPIQISGSISKNVFGDKLSLYTNSGVFIRKHTILVKFYTCPPEPVPLPLMSLSLPLPLISLPLMSLPLMSLPLMMMGTLDVHVLGRQ